MKDTSLWCYNRRQIIYGQIRCITIHYTLWIIYGRRIVGVNAWQDATVAAAAAAIGDRHPTDPSQVPACQSVFAIHHSLIPGPACQRVAAAASRRCVPTPPPTGTQSSGHLRPTRAALTGGRRLEAPRRMTNRSRWQMTCERWRQVAELTSLHTPRDRPVLARSHWLPSWTTHRQTLQRVLGRCLLGVLLTAHRIQLLHFLHLLPTSGPLCNVIFQISSQFWDAKC